MRLKLLILRWIDDRGDGDDGNIAPIPSRLQFLRGSSWGWMRENSGMEKNLWEKGKRREKEEHTL